MWRLLFVTVALGIWGCQECPPAGPQHDKAFEGQWLLKKKIYSSGTESVFDSPEETLFILPGGELKYEFLNHRQENQQRKGEWQSISTKGEDGKTARFWVKRTPMYNGLFELRYEVIEMSETEMILEESPWDLGETELSDRLVYQKAVSN